MHKNFLLLLSGAFLLKGFVFLFFVPSYAQENFLKPMQWNARVLVLSGSDEEAISRQIYNLGLQKESFIERDIVTMRFQNHSIVVFEYLSVPRYHEFSAKGVQLPYQTELSGFNLTLIGKDGDVKKRWDDVVEPRDIFDVIDAMPMRQREMQLSFE